MTDNNEMNEYFLKKQRNDIRMEYNPDNMMPWNCTLCINIAAIYTRRL